MILFSRHLPVQTITTASNQPFLIFMVNVKKSKVNYTVLFQHIALSLAKSVINRDKSFSD